MTTIIPVLKRDGFLLFYCFFLIYHFFSVAPASGDPLSVISQEGLANILQPHLAEHPGSSGIYVLEKGEESLLARAWLADNAKKSIDVQYFIWSTDNIGILAAESLLRAAERGVSVRVIVDDLLVDAPDEVMVALAAHENIEIKIYNSRHSVGVSLVSRIKNLLFDFRSSNQRMHDKTFTVDSLAVITGGRNMADEYFDYNHTYNFRDRDALLIGPVVEEVESNFDKFWKSDLSQDVQLLLHHDERLTVPERNKIYEGLHQYANNPENLEPDVAESIKRIPDAFPFLTSALIWDDIEFISDIPGKNKAKGLGGGGRTTARLVKLLMAAEKTVTVQSPYLVLPKEGFTIFEELHSRGVKIRIVTNSLASTDNLQAFSGYSKQRQDILDAGVEVFEYKPEPEIQKELIARYKRIEKEIPTFAIHAKTLVIDGEDVFIGTFNLDPRSANLNTEVGILVQNRRLAKLVEKKIHRDMQPENSWNATEENPDRFAPLTKRMKVFFWKLLPITPLL